MTTEPITDDDDAPVQPRVRTLKTAAAEQPAASPDPTPENGSPPVDLEPDPEDDDEPVAQAVPIHSGWTAGQQVIDTTSGYASALQLTAELVIIKFLEDQPYANFRRHWIERVGPQGSKKRPFTCLETIGRTCPLCGIADKPQAVSAFNVVLIGDDGQVILKTWDVGARLFNVLKAYSTDPKVGPLSKDLFAVNKTGARGQQQTNVTPIKTARLLEDYGIVPPTPEMLKKAGKYGADVVQIPKKSDLEEIAEEIAEFD
jgi:hypothetical protein